MAFGALIAYRNLIWDASLAAMAEFEDEAPLNNLKTPQLGEIARASYAATTVAMAATFAQASTVQLIGVLNVPLHSITSIAVGLTTSGGPEAFVFPEVSYPTADYFPSNVWLLLDAPVEGVTSMQLTIEMAEDAEPFQAGGLWAGPAWVLPKGMDAFWTMQIAETAVKVETDGGQTRAEPQRRYRVVTINITALSEAEALGIPGDELSLGDDPLAISPENTLIDLAFYSCMSRPIVVMPRLSRVERMHALGVYGYITAPITIQPNSSPTKGGPVYAGSDRITIKESL